MSQHPVAGLHLGGTLALDTRMQALCRSMHVQGMLIDQQERERLKAKYTAKSRDYAAKCRTLALNPGLNLNSPAQVGDQLYASRLSGGFGCEVVAYTDGGAPSTADPAIRPLLRDPTLPQDARDFILAYRQYKKSDKILGTFLRPAEPVPQGESRRTACLTAVAEARGLLDQARRLLPAAATADRGAFLRKAEDALDAAVDRAGRLLDDRLWTTDLWAPAAGDGWGDGQEPDGGAAQGDTDEDGVPHTADPNGGVGALIRAVYSSEDRAALRRALHDVWALQPRRTPKGGITVARGALVELWRDPAGADSGARAFLGVVLQAFAACSEARRLALPPADAEEDRCYLRRQTGRVHSDWKAHVVVTGRLASSPNLQNCFLPNTTDVLTRRGWMRVENLHEDDEVAQWTPGPPSGVDQGCIKFVRPLGRISRPLGSESALRLATRAWRSSTTAGHQIPVVTRKGALEVRTAESMIGDRKIVHGGQYTGGSVDPGDAWITLLCAAQADGHFRADGADYLYFTFTKQRKIDRLVAAATKAGVPHEATPKRGYDQMRVKLWGPAVARLREALAWDPTRAVGETKAVYKAFGPWLLDWTFRALDRFCTEILFWDGCWTRKSSYASAVRENTEWVQTAFALTGRRKAHFHRYVSQGGSVSWQVYLSSKHYSWSTNFERQEVPLAEDTPVYCVTVPSGFLLVRSEDQIHVSGNCPRAIRSMFVPAPGRVYVYADADQLELRTAAARWSALTGIRSRYLDAFATTKKGSDGKVYNMDPHQMSMHGIFGDDIWSWPGAPPTEWHFYKKWPGGKIADLFDIQRDLVKRVVYLGAYAGEALKAHEVLTAAEDDEGTLIYQDLSVREVAAMLHAWRESVPEFVAGWDAEIALWERQGYLEDPISGRRAWFRNVQAAEEDRSQIVNFPIQSAGAALIARGLFAFAEHYPGGFAGPGTGVVNLCHDAITVEVPEAEAPRARELLQQCMKQEDPALPGVVFPAEAVIKTRWEDARP